MFERCARELQAGAGFSHGEPRPPHEVLKLRRAVTLEVPQRQLGGRLGAVQASRPAHPLLQQRVCELLAASRPARDHPVQLGEHQQVREALALGRDPGCAKNVT